MNGLRHTGWRLRGGAMACVLCLSGLAAAQTPVGTAFTSQARIRIDRQPIADTRGPAPH